MQRHFVGWAPTITGRISFSRIGERLTRRRRICNLTARDDGWIFGSELRTSHDGPFSPLIMRLLGSLPDVLYLPNLKVEAAPLPVNQSDGPPTMQDDRRGALHGHVIFLAKGKWARASAQAGKLRDLRVLTSRARDPQLKSAEQDALHAQAEEIFGELWASMKAEYDVEPDGPAFGRAEVELLRSGQCTITVRAEDLFLNRTLKAAHRAGVDGDLWAAAETSFHRGAEAVGRQVFFFIKDISHNHYHHDEHADLLITPAPAELGDDHWRRETQYALARLAIARRREGSAMAFREALGVIAYADAFQKHFSGWVQPRARGPARKLKTHFDYDFAALKASLESSLKVREAHDGSNRQTALFLFAFLFTALSLTFIIRRVIEPPVSSLPAPSATPKFDALVGLLATHPPQSILGGIALAAAFDIIFVRPAVPRLPLSTLVGGLARASDAFMATAIRYLQGRPLPDWLSPRWVAYSLGNFIVGLVLLLFSILLYWGVNAVYTSVPPRPSVIKPPPATSAPLGGVDPFDMPPQGAAPFDAIPFYDNPVSAGAPFTPAPSGPSVTPPGKAGSVRR